MYVFVTYVCMCAMYVCNAKMYDMLFAYVCYVQYVGYVMYACYVMKLCMIFMYIRMYVCML